MVRRILLYKVLTALSLAAAWPAMALDLPESTQFIGRYDFSWSAIPLASAELSMAEDRDHYSLRLAITSRGIVNLFTRHRSDTTASGIRRDGKYLPQSYESHYWTKDKPRHIKLAFDAKGAVTEELVEPPENRQERPEVPHALKDGALDPLTLLMAVRAGVTAPRVFDAKHLYDGKAVKQEETVLRTYDGKQNSVPYAMTRIPVAGMTQKEMKDYEKGEPTLTFYFSADNRRVPLYTHLPVYLGSLTGSLAKECKTWDECKVN